MTLQVMERHAAESPLFDARWYSRRNRLEGGPEAAMRHYLDQGVPLGLAPSPIFERHWYLALQPEAAHHPLGILGHFLDTGRAQATPPNPWFDAAYYLTQLGDEAPAAREDPAAHFVACGAARGLVPSPVFDAAWYRRGVPDLSPAINAYAHFMYAGFAPHLSFSPLFDEAWYRHAHDLPDDGIHPYVAFLLNGCRQRLRASPYFDTRWYFDTYHEHLPPDVDPIAHYVQYGEALGWSATKYFDPLYFRARYAVPAAESAMAAFRRRSASGAEDLRPNAAFSTGWYRRRYLEASGTAYAELEHYEDCGEPAGYVPDVGFERIAEACGAPAAAHCARLMRVHRFAPAPEDRVDVPMLGWQQDRWRADVARHLAHCTSAPHISIIIPVHNKCALTMLCVESVASTLTDLDVEILIADDRSSDTTAATFAGFEPALRVVPNRREQGFIGNCNHAAAAARGEFLLFLNNDTITLPGWLHELLGVFAQDASVGVAGARLLFTDGVLQESGGILWRDGEAWNYGRGQPALLPEACYRRPADYVSGAALMVRRDVWDALEGFDATFTPAYCEDSDLCLRARAAGWQVVVQPLSTVMHFEGVSHDAGGDTSAMKRRSVERFSARWSAALADRGEPGEDVLRAAHRHEGPRMLVVDATTPNPAEDAGSLTCVEILRGFQHLGMKVTFVAADNLLYMPHETGALQREGIEVIYRPFYLNLPDFLARRGAEFDYVLVFRCEMARRFYQDIYTHAPQARLMFHNSDLHSLRQLRASQLGDDLPETRWDARKILAEEMYAMHGARVTVLHSVFEQEVLQRLAPAVRTHVFPWVFEPRHNGVGFHARRDIAFLGGYRHVPNVDAVEYFVEAIWPRLVERLDDALFNMVGSHAPPRLTELAADQPRVRLVGFVEDLDPLFAGLRVSVVPLRYGAGLKGKIVTSMAYGVPVVTTSCGAEGMRLVDGRHVLIRDDPAAFAEAVCALYTDADLWAHLSAEGLQHVRETYSSAAGREHLRTILNMADCDRIDLQALLQ